MRVCSASRSSPARVLVAFAQARGLGHALADGVEDAWRRRRTAAPAPRRSGAGPAAAAARRRRACSRPARIFSSERLARAVAPDQRDALAGLERERGAVEQRHMAEGEVGVGKREQGHRGIVGDACGRRATRMARPPISFARPPFLGEAQPMCSHRLIAAALAICLGGLAPRAQADEVHVAVAANFSAPMQRIAADFEKDSGHKAQSGFRCDRQVLCADQERRTVRGVARGRRRDAGQVEAGRPGRRGSRFTYAIGSLVLWSATAGLRRCPRRGAQDGAVPQAGDRQPQDGALWPRGGRDADQPRPARRARAPIRAGREHRADLPVRRDRQCRARLRRALAGLERRRVERRLGVAGAGRIARADPAGRRAAQAGRAQRRRARAACTT